MNLKSMTLPELTAVLKELGQPAFRAKQVYTWLHKGVRAYDEMTNLPKSLRDTLAREYPICAPKVVRRQESARDGTIKYLWELSDGNCVETVLMRYHYGNTVCISTEVGCRMGCAFCASTIGGLVRRLEPYEMLDEVLFTQVDSGLPISHIVLMGIGEPLDNYRNVLDFLTILSSPEGRNLSLRHVSLSTCGLCDRIDELAELGLGLTLSISLHAADDETRSGIMPVNKQYNIARLMQSCKNYFAKTGRRISYEYALIAGVNDSPAHAEALAKLLGGQNCHVNLIPINPVEEREYEKSDQDSIAKFKLTLEKNHINATIRKSMGSDIDAACGQLRRKYAFHHQEDSHAF